MPENPQNIHQVRVYSLNNRGYTRGLYFSRESAEEAAREWAALFVAYRKDKNFAMELGNETFENVSEEFIKAVDMTGVSYIGLIQRDGPSYDYVLIEDAYINP